MVGINVEGGGLNEIFGFKEANSARIRHEIVFDLANPLTSSFDDPREHFIPFSNPKSGADAAGSLGYSGTEAPLASFDNDTTAITAHNVGEGHATHLALFQDFFCLQATTIVNRGSCAVM